MFVLSPPKPTVASPVDVVGSYINKHIATCDVKSITKLKTQYNVHTSLVCGGCEKTDVPFTITMTKKNKCIQQKCSCKTRGYQLTDKIIDIL